MRVLTIQNPPLMNDLVVDFDEDRVSRTGWLNMNRIPEMFSGGSGKVAAEGYSRETSSRKAAEVLWRNFVHVPDEAVGWVPEAVRRGLEITEEWRPDVILASSGPPSSFLVAARISKRSRVPWVADYRDLWTGNPSSMRFGWREKIDARLERRVLASAAATISVNDHITGILSDMHGKPSHTIWNGYDDSDLNEAIGVRPEPSDQLLVRHMGTIYEGHRDPSPLFEALHDDAQLREKVRIEFYGRNLANLRALIERYSIANAVSTLEAVSRADALRLEAASDALLLLTSPDPVEQGSLPGKFFEYVGIGRPILQVGSPSLGARLVVERGLGWGVANASQARDALLEMLDAKSTAGSLTGLSPEQRADFSRAGQIERLREVLRSAVSGEPISA